MTKICIFISRLHLLRLDHVKQIFFFISVLRLLRRNHVNFFPLLLLRSLRRDHDKKYIFSISALSVLCLNQNKKRFFFLVAATFTMPWSWQRIYFYWRTRPTTPWLRKKYILVYILALRSLRLDHDWKCIYFYSSSRLTTR